MNFKTTIKKLDSIRTLILNEELTFTKAVERYSEDDNSKSSGGLLFNSQTGSPLFETGALSPELYFSVEKLNVGETSRPVAFSTPDNKKAFRIIKLNKEINAHKASLDTDYEEIKNTALAQKKETRFKEWLEKKGSLAKI